MAHDNARLPIPEDRWFDRHLGTEGGMSSFVRSTPEMRRSFARYILCGHGGERNWMLADLADWDPSALSPWADHVVRFDDDALDALLEVDFDGFWRASVGASDVAVDDLAARVRESPPEGGRDYDGYPELADARVDLLVGCDTDRALHHLGELGRSFEPIRETCAARGLLVPAEGPAVRRYAAGKLNVRGAREDGSASSASQAPASTPGLACLVPGEEILVDPSGLGCAAPLVAALVVDLSLLPGEPLASARAKRACAFASLCESCQAGEEAADYRWRPAAGGRVELIGDRDHRCPGSPRTPPHFSRVWLARDPLDGSDAGAALGSIGGWPRWAQSQPSWPSCCDKPMFFVAKVNVAALGGYDAHVYSFQCECGQGAQTVQTT